MIKILEMKNNNLYGRSYLIHAFADTKEEVTDDAEFVGLPSDAGIDMGSSIITASGDFAYRKSDGSWNWI